MAGPALGAVKGGWAMKRGEQLLALLLLLLSLFLFRESTLIESGAEFGMGPGFLPLWLSVGLAIVSVALLFRASAQPASNFDSSVWASSDGALRVVAVLAFYLVAIIVMNFLGMPISIAIIVAATVPILGGRDWRGISVAAVVSALGIYLVFGRFLNVPLPMGVLEELLPLY